MGIFLFFIKYMLPSIIFVKNTYTCVPVLLIGDFFKFQIDVHICRYMYWWKENIYRIMIYISVHRGYSKLGQKKNYFVCQRKKIYKIIKASRPQFLWEKFWYMRNKNYTCAVITETQKFWYWFF